jgi:ABC-type antimicrobial peptide transport system permease subunit
VKEKGSTDEPVSSWTFYSAMDTTCMSMLGFEIVEQYCAPEDGKHYVTEETRDRYGVSADNPLVGGQVSGTASYPVCGVIKDYRSFNPVSGNSMADGHNIIAVMMNPSRSASMMVELSEEGMKDVEESIKQMQETCRAVTKEACGVEKDFDIRTVDDILAEPMEELENLLLMVLCFMFVSVLISALGLFAMSISYTEQQSKQIALRKVMGASVAGASWQLARPFLLLCLLAAVLSTPLAIKGSQMYLELFPNRIGFPWWLLLVSVLVTLLIAFLSICWHTLSVARRNPVESIKTE